MTGKTHLLGGIMFGAGTAIAIQSDPISAGILITSATVGSLVPDIDHPNSMISRKLPLLSWIYQFVALIDKGVSKLLKTSYKAGHRGITHSLLVYLALFIPVLFCVESYELFLLFSGLILGAISHIAFDMCNYGGDKILLPFSSKKFWLLPKKLRIKTKSQFKTKEERKSFEAKKETIFAVIILIIDAVLVKFAFGL